MELIDLATYRLYHHRASFKVYQAFNVNRFEMEMLINYIAFCHRTGRRTASQRQVFCAVTRNARHWPKMTGYWRGTIEKGLIEPVELAKPGAFTYVLTQTGSTALDLYWSTLNTLIEEAKEVEHRNQQHKHGKPLKPYIYTQAPVNIVEDFGHGNYKSLPNR